MTFALAKPVIRSDNISAVRKSNSSGDSNPVLHVIEGLLEVFSSLLEIGLNIFL